MKYGAEDIHRMRRACGSLWILDQSMSYKQSDLDLAAESRLVTYMANGTTPDELDVEVARRSRERFQRDEEASRRYREAMRKGPQR